VPEFVLDASVAVALLLGESAAADFAGLSVLPSISPAIWRVEVANVMLVSYRRQRITADELAELLEDIAEMDVELDLAGLDAVLTLGAELAGRHGLTLYDATYLELAIRSGLPLASLDKRLRAAATMEGVALLP
jgi:predicted nucleic acid-binding protein